MSGHEIDERAGAECVAWVTCYACDGEGCRECEWTGEVCSGCEASPCCCDPGPEEQWR